MRRLTVTPTERGYHVLYESDSGLTKEQKFYLLMSLVWGAVILAVSSGFFSLFR